MKFKRVALIPSDKSEEKKLLSHKEELKKRCKEQGTVFHKKQIELYCEIVEKYINENS